MCIIMPVSTIGPYRTSTQGKASNPNDRERYQLPGIHIEPKCFATGSFFCLRHGLWGLGRPWPMGIDRTAYGSATRQGRHRRLHAQRGTHLADILGRGLVERCMLPKE